MARPRDISPCMKRERVYGHGRRFTACECAHEFRCSASRPEQPEWISYGLNEKGHTIRLEDKSKLPERTLLTVPCDETFLEKRSPGTRLHANAQGENTKFTGCLDVERFLINGEFVRYEPRERIGRKLDTGESAELFKSLADYGRPTSDDLLVFLLEGARRELSHRQMHQMTVSAHDWQERLEHEQSPVTDADATSEPLSELQEPERDHDEAATRVAGLLSELTTKQRNAVRAVYLDNFEKLSRAQIARRMGIGLDSLNERLEGAFKKLRATRP